MLEFKKIEGNEWTWRETAGKKTHLLVVTGEGEVKRFYGANIRNSLRIDNIHRDYAKIVHQFTLAVDVTLVEITTQGSPFEQYENWADVAKPVEQITGHPIKHLSLEWSLKDHYPVEVSIFNDRIAGIERYNAVFADVILSEFSSDRLDVRKHAIIGFESITVEEAANLGRYAPWEVGDENVAAVFSQELGIAVKHNDTETTLQSGVVALVGQYRGPRLSEGATSLPEGATIEWLRVEVI